MRFCRSKDVVKYLNGKRDTINIDVVFINAIYEKDIDDIVVDVCNDSDYKIVIDSINVSIVVQLLVMIATTSTNNSYITKFVTVDPIATSITIIIMIITIVLSSSFPRSYYSSSSFYFLFLLMMK